MAGMVAFGAVNSEISRENRSQAIGRFPHAPSPHVVHSQPIVPEFATGQTSHPWESPKQKRGVPCANTEGAQIHDAASLLIV